MEIITPVLTWWLVITLFGLIGWPLAFSLLRHLPDRGFALIRPVGLLLTGYILWLGGSFRLLQNSTAGIMIAMAIVLGLGLFWLRQTREAGEVSVLIWLRREWLYVLVVELLFHVAFAGWAVFRAYNPNIETAGGEKWMEIAFINGALRSDYFPPQDPWLAGFAISYYYFGYVLMAMVTRLTGLVSTVAFNLYIPTLFAMTLAAAFSIVANLVALYRNYQLPQDEQEQLPLAHSPTPPISPSPNLPTSQPPHLPISNLPSLLTGLFAALFAGILGNLEGLLEVFHQRGLLSAAFWTWLDIRDLKAPPVGPGDSWVPDRFIWWWRASRVLTDYNLAGQEQEVIDEFPFFSFLLGDVHPHVLALPFVLLVVALALNLLANQKQTTAGRQQVVTGEPELSVAGRRSPVQTLSITHSFFSMADISLGLTESWHTLSYATGGRQGFVIYALCLGALSFLNTWDFPIYLSLVGLSLIVWQVQRTGNYRVGIQQGVIGMILLGIGGVLLYFPFYATFQSQARGFLPNLWNPTRLPQFFVFFGPFLVAIAGLLVAMSGRYRGWRSHLSWSLPLMIFGPMLVMLLLFITTLIAPAGRGYIQGILNDPNVQQVIGATTISALIQESVGRRLSAPGTFLLVGGLLGWGLALLAGGVMERPPTRSKPGDAEAHVTRTNTGGPAFVEHFVLILLLVGLGLVLSVEWVYLRDNFGYRMNTVFKFYFQAWVLLALASAFAIYYVSKNLSSLPALLWQGTLALLVTGGLVYPALAIPNKADYFRNEPTLNGIEWIAQVHPGDYAGIQWLRANAPADAVILEAPGVGQFGSYNYSGRVSAMTGLPTLLGWGGHQSQWRGNYDEPGRREPDIEALFTTLDLEQARRLLGKYDIDYVYIGPLERERYAPPGLQKFDYLMDKAFEQDNVTIYQRRP